MRLFKFDHGSDPVDQTSARNRPRDREGDTWRGYHAEPIRVLHVAQSVAGGIASFFEELAPHQSRTFGEENVKFLIPSDGAQHLAAVERDQLTFFGSRSRRPATLWDFARTTLRTIEQFRPDVVHLHSSFAGALRMFLPVRPDGPKVVYCPHGWAFGMEVSPAKKRAYAAVEKRLVHATDLIIVNSKSEQALAVRYGLPSQKLKVIANGISWAPLPGRSGSTDGIRIAFVGRHDRQKGLDILLETIERFRLPHIQFHIVGEAVWNDGRNSGSHRPNVTFHGWLDRAAITDLLGKVDAVVMPSRWEAFGLVAIEAMRAGIPVIASNRGALPEVVGHGAGGYIFDLDEHDALGMLLMHLDRSELRRLGHSARERWEKHFVADRMNRETEQVYRQLLSKPGHRPERSASAALDVIPELTV